MPFYERGPMRINYEGAGSGFPSLIIPGGGLNSTLSSLQTASPFNPMERYKDDFRCKPRPERRGDHLSLERFAVTHRRGCRARTALPQGARIHHSLGIPNSNCVELEEWQ